MCEVEGDGIYCGAHLDIDCFQRNPNDWYGEGDDMIFIDGENWPPIASRHRHRGLVPLRLLPDAGV